MKLKIKETTCELEMFITAYEKKKIKCKKLHLYCTSLEALSDYLTFDRDFFLITYCSAMPYFF